MAKISMIVPVYNVEKYLDKCIDSIVKQTYKNLEIILINDGSTDSCLEICNKHKQQDKRIIVINKENGGLSDARNRGIEISTGEYIMFIDSDDWISVDMVEKLYNLVHKNNACIAQCGFISVFDENKINICDEKESIIFMNNKQALENIYKKDGVKNIVVWNKIYKKKLFDNVRFPIGKLHEDEFTTYKILDKCKKMVDTNKVMYYYRQREGSIVRSNFSIRKLDSLDAVKEKISYFNYKGYFDLELLSQCQFQYLLRYFYIKIYDSDIDNKDIYLDKILNENKKYFFEFMNNKYIPNKSKFFIVLMYVYPKIFYIIYKRRLKN